MFAGSDEPLVVNKVITGLLNVVSKVMEPVFELVFPAASVNVTVIVFVPSLAVDLKFNFTFGSCVLES